MSYKSREKEREYQHQYHLRTWEKRKKRHLELKDKRERALAVWFKTYKGNLKCIICGEDYTRCLDFHHLNNKQKDFSVADMVCKGYSTDSIMKEISKCIVLCRNCHAKIHYSKKSLLIKMKFLSRQSLKTKFINFKAA